MRPEPATLADTQANALVVTRSAVGTTPSLAAPRQLATAPLSTEAAARLAPVTQQFGPAPMQAQKGVVIKVYTDPNFATKSAAVVEHLATLGVNSVSLVVFFSQSTYQSADPQLKSYDPSTSDIQSFIGLAHARGMSVVVRPLMDDSNLSPQWRGTVLPIDPTSWFNTYYNNILLPYASLSGIDGLNVGSELTTLAYTYPDRWSSLITRVRGLRPGLRLTYSSGFDWIALPGEPQPYPIFAESLDLIGVDAFFPLNGVTNGYDQSQLINAWQPSLGKVFTLATYYHKPVVFTEIGLASQCCTLSQPFVYNAGAAPNMGAQATYYAAACRAIRPYHFGLYWWDYNGLDPLSSPLTDNGFSPYGKPAEQEMARCYQSVY